MPSNISVSDKYRYNADRAGRSDKTYFSGANTRIYFGDIWVEEMASLQFQVQENVAPIYGFNSYMFDKVARGTRLVTGAFILNHTDTGYLDVILDRLYRDSGTSNQKLFSSNNQDGLIGDLTEKESDRNIQTLLELDGGQSYEHYIDSLKNSYWGDTTSTQGTVQKTGVAREYDTHYFKNPEGSTETNPLKEHGFNILIDYSPSANERDFEAVIRNVKREGSLYQTFRSIIGVHLTGENQILAPDGQAIQTQYNFVARDIDGDISQLSLKHNRIHNQY